MTAEDARKESQKILDNKYLLSEGIVRKAIDAAIQKGEFKCFVYEIVPEHVQNILAKQGYQVNTSFERNETLVTISW